MRPSDFPVIRLPFETTLRSHPSPFEYGPQYSDLTWEEYLYWVWHQFLKMNMLSRQELEVLCETGPPSARIADLVSKTVGPPGGMMLKVGIAVPGAAFRATSGQTVMTWLSSAAGEGDGDRSCWTDITVPSSVDRDEIERIRREESKSSPSGTPFKASPVMTPLKNKLLQLAAESSITIHSPSTAGTGTSIRKQRNVKGTPMSKVSPSIASPLSIIDTPSKPSLLPPLDLPKSLSALLAEADSTPVNAAQTMTLPTPPASPKTPTPFRSKIPRPIYPARPLTMTQKIPTRLLFQAHANKNIDPPTPLPATTVYTTIPRYASAHDLHALYNNIASGTTIPEVKANGPVEEGIIIRDFAPSIHGSRKLARVSEVEHEGDEHRKEHEPVKTKEATENSDVQRLREHQQLENKATTQIDGSTATAGHITAVPDHEEAHKKHGLICKLKEKMAGKSHKSKTVERESSNKLTKKAHPPRDFRDRVLRRVFPVVL